MLQDETGEERYFSTTEIEPSQKEFANAYNKMLKNTWQMKQGFGGTLKKSINPDRMYQLASGGIRRADMGKITPMGGNTSFRLPQKVSNKLSKGLTREQSLMGTVQDTMKSVGRRGDNAYNMKEHLQARGVKKVRGAKPSSPTSQSISAAKDRMLNNR